MSFSVNRFLLLGTGGYLLLGTGGRIIIGQVIGDYPVSLEVADAAVIGITAPDSATTEIDTIDILVTDISVTDV